MGKIDYYFKMRYVLELPVNQGNEEMRATYTDLYDRLDGLPPPVVPHAHYDDEENLKNIFCFLLVLVLLNTLQLAIPLYFI